MVWFTLIIIGLCLGSFVNALVWRLREKESSAEKTSKKQREELSIIRGRSMCVHCRHVLRWNDLIPVVSWIALRGKCRYCKKPISVQYPVVELATAGLFVFSYHFWPESLTSLQNWLVFVAWLTFLVGFVAMIVYDLRWMILPDAITFWLLALAAAQILVLGVWNSDIGLILNSVGGLLAVGGLFWLIFQLSAGKWTGGGDVKLGFVIGLLAGSFLKGMLLVFVASLFGTIVTICLVVVNKYKLSKKVAFGPYLIAATVVVYLFGDSLIGWYSSLISVT